MSRTVIRIDALVLDGIDVGDPQVFRAGLSAAVRDRVAALQAHRLPRSRLRSAVAGAVESAVADAAPGGER